MDKITDFYIWLEFESKALHTDSIFKVTNVEDNCLFYEQVYWNSVWRKYMLDFNYYNNSFISYNG